MITCHLRYVIDPHHLAEFEHYGRTWIGLVEKFGGKHTRLLHALRGRDNIAIAMFSFPTLAAYEEYRTQSLDDPDCQAAFGYAKETGCIYSYERTFFRPVFSADG